MRAYLLFACICIALATRSFAPVPVVETDSAATTGMVISALQDGVV